MTILLEIVNLLIFNPDQRPLPASEEFKRSYKRALPYPLEPRVAVNIYQCAHYPSKPKDEIRGYSIVVKRRIVVYDWTQTVPAWFNTSTESPVHVNVPNIGVYGWDCLNYQVENVETPESVSAVV